jgi:hypothetical protein
MAREGEAGAREGNRRRRDRRRRGSGDRPDRPEQQEGQPEVMDALTTPSTGVVASHAEAPAPAAQAPWEAWPEAVEEAAPAPARVERVADIQAAPVNVEAVKPERHVHAEPTVHAPAPVAVPVAPPPARRSEPVPAPKPAPVFHEIPELPPIALTLPPETGLELVETKHSAPSLPEAEQDVPKGPRRIRPPKVQIADEPLQLVETQKGNPTIAP